MKNIIKYSIQGCLLLALIALMPSCLGIVLFEAPDTAQSGSTIYVKVRVKTDVMEQSGFTVVFVLSYDQIYDEQDLKLKTVISNTSLNENQYQDVGTYVTIPNTYSSGKYYLLAIPYDKVFPGLYIYPHQQNVFYKPITITNNVNYGRDLVTTNVHIYSPVTIMDNGSMRSFSTIQTLKNQARIVFTVENRGLSSTNSSSVHCYFLNTKTGNWSLIGSTTIPALNGNGSWEGTIYADLRGKGLTNMTYQVYLFTDLNRAVTETRRDNNLYTNWAPVVITNNLQEDEPVLLTTLQKNDIKQALIAAKIEDMNVLSSTSSTESTDNPLSITDKVSKTPSVFTVFPNPSSDMVMVSFNQERTSDVIIQLFDAAGKNVNTMALLQVEEGQYQQEISLKGLSKGIYIVKCLSGEKVFTQKLVVN